MIEILNLFLAMLIEPILFILKNDGIADLMQNFSMALLTMIVPIAILFFEKDKGDYIDLDKAVILGRVINAKLFFISVIWSFISVIFWDKFKNAPDELNYAFRAIVFGLWVVYNIVIIKTIRDSYRWIKGHERFRFRFEYLENTNNNLDMELAWRSVWMSKKINRENEEKFFSIFEMKVTEKLSKKKDSSLVVKLLNDFDLFIGNRSQILLMKKEPTLKILDWHYEIWAKRKKGKDYDYYDLESTLNQIVYRIFERALKGGFVNHFFDSLKEHCGKHKDSKYYTSVLTASGILTTLFNSTSESGYRYDIWKHYFPEEWKITLNNLKDKNNNIVRIVFNNYQSWLQNKIMGGSRDFDNDLEYVTRYLFSEVEPITWANILYLVYSSWTNNERIKSFVKRDKIFGLAGRIFSSHEKTTNERLERYYNELEEKSYELAVLLYPSLFNNKSLKDLIDEAVGLRDDEEISKDEMCKKRLERIISILEGVRRYLKNRDKN